MAAIPQHGKEEIETPRAKEILRDGKRVWKITYLPFSETPLVRPSRGYGYGRYEELYGNRALARARYTRLKESGYIDDIELREHWMTARGEIVGQLLDEWKTEEINPSRRRMAKMKFKWKTHRSGASRYWDVTAPAEPNADVLSASVGHMLGVDDDYSVVGISTAGYESNVVDVGDFGKLAPAKRAAERWLKRRIEQGVSMGGNVQNPKGRATMSKTKANPARPKDWIPYGTIGDVNPIEYDGGIIYATPWGYQMLYFETYDEDRVSIWHVNIEDDITEQADWADWKEIARYTGQSLGDLKKAGKSKDPIARAQALSSIAGHDGWTNFDDSPRDMTIEDAEKKWDADVNAAHKAASKRPRSNPCAKGDILIDRKGYTRKGYTRGDGTKVKGARVPPASFCIKDPGTKGRRARGAEKGPYRKKKAWIQTHGGLGGPGYTSKTAAKRHAILNKCVKADSYRTCLGRVMVLLRDTELKASTRSKLVADKNYLVKRYGGPGSFGPRKNPEVILDAADIQIMLRQLLADAQHMIECRQYPMAAKSLDTAWMYVADAEFSPPKAQEMRTRLKYAAAQLPTTHRSKLDWVSSKPNPKGKSKRRGGQFFAEERDLLMDLLEWEQDEGSRGMPIAPGRASEAATLSGGTSEGLGFHFVEYDDDAELVWLTDQGRSKAKALAKKHRRNPKGKSKRRRNGTREEQGMLIKATLAHVSGLCGDLEMDRGSPRKVQRAGREAADEIAEDLGLNDRVEEIEDIVMTEVDRCIAAPWHGIDSDQVAEDILDLDRMNPRTKTLARRMSNP